MAEGGGCGPLEGKTWSKVASNVPDPPTCIEQCRARFLQKVIHGYDDSKLSEACRVLSKDNGAKEQLWDLYCCNSSACGVSSEMGQDPGVNWVINQCQSGIQDPGPPSLGYLCPVITTQDNCQKPFLVGDDRPRPTSYTTPSSGFWATPTPASMTSSSSSSSSSHSASETSTPSSSLKMSDEGQPPSSSLPLGPRIAIGISSALTLVAVVALAMCLYRRRFRRSYTQSIKSIKSSDIKHCCPLAQAAACSPTPLISPPASTHERIPSTTTANTNTTAPLSPLTPPLPLRERKLLPTSPPTQTSSDVGSSVPGTPPSSHTFSTTTASSTSGFPRSPRTAAAQRNSSFSMSLRQSRPPKSPFNPPSTIFQGQELKTPARDGPGVGSSSSAAATATATTTTTNRTATPGSSSRRKPSSPLRPPRPHGMPLHVPGLVCPGPPPNRALPPTPTPPPPPPARVISPVSSSTLLRQHSMDEGHNISMALAAGFVPPRNPARGVVLDRDAREFSELTESYARESQCRDSWGSWSVGVGGTGIGSGSIHKEGTRVNTLVMTEAELERLGGTW